MSTRATSDKKDHQQRAKNQPVNNERHHPDPVDKREEIIDFLVANFVSGERWGGLFDIQASKRYEDWKAKKNQREYLFQRDVSKILLEMEKQKVGAFFEKNGKQGLTFRLYFGRMIEIETLVILDKIFDFVEETDDVLLEDDCVAYLKGLTGESESYYNDRINQADANGDIPNWCN